MLPKHPRFSFLPVWLMIATAFTVLPGASAIEPQISERDQKKIDAAIPAKASVSPRSPRKLLIFGLNVGYPGHFSSLHANYAFSQMGQKTGAFESVVSHDPEMFRPETLRQFDAVFFNNTVGNLFQDPELRQSLVEFIYSGGGMLGVHGTSVAFTFWPGAREDWPEFGRMIGGRGANHKNNDEHVVVKLDDPTSPINAPFNGQSFDYRDEFFRVHEPYSRNRLRILLSIDTEKTDLTEGGVPRGKCERADNDYALAWIRNYGRGRTFYCTIAHNPYVFWDPKMLEFYLGAIQFALGDLPVPTTPSAQLTPAVRAQERLGWCLELGTITGQTATLFQTIDLAAKYKLSYVGAHDTQLVSQDIPKKFTGGLSDDELVQIRLRLDDAGVRLMTYALEQLPVEDVEARRVFQFARKMGVETLWIEELPTSLDTITRLAQEFDIRVSSPSTTASQSRDGLSNADQRPYIGRDVDLADWIGSDRAVIERGARDSSRVFTCRSPNQQVKTADGRVLSPAEVQRRLAAAMRQLAPAQRKPLILRIPHSEITSNAHSDIAPNIELLNRVSLQLR